MPDDVVPLEIRMAGPEVVAAWRDPRGVLAELSRARAEAERLRSGFEWLIQRIHDAEHVGSRDGCEKCDALKEAAIASARKEQP